MPSEIGEMWQDWREHKREEKAKYMPERIAAILALRASGHTVVVLQDGTHYRVDGRVDLYPVHRRYHDIKTGKRSFYRDPANCVSRALGREHASGVQQER